MTDKYKLFYDSECSLCSRFQKALEMLDKGERVEYFSINDEKTFKEFPELDEEACFEAVHMIAPEGDILVGSEVVEKLVKLIPGVSKFAWLIESESSKKAMNIFYDRLNDMRLMKRRGCFRCGSPRRRRYDVRGEK